MEAEPKHDKNYLKTDLNFCFTSLCFYPQIGKMAAAAMLNFT